MPVITRNNKKIWQRRTPWQGLLTWFTWLLIITLVVYCWQVISSVTNWFFLATAPEAASNLISRMFPPNWTYLNRLWRPLWDTLNIATLGTLLAILIAVPVAFLGARNTTPNALTRGFALLVVVGSRSVPSLIWALMLVAILGPGLLAGILAIALRSIGFIAKLLYEAIEEIDAKQVEAITATGAGPGKVITYGIVPQVMPAFAGISVYRWDINIRESTILGLVGAGGIGIQLEASVQALRWSDASVIFISIFVLVLISEWISAKVRQAIT